MYKVEELQKDSSQNEITYLESKYKVKEFIYKRYGKSIQISLLNVIDKVIKSNGFIAIEFRAEIGGSGYYKPVMLSIQNDSIFNTNRNKTEKPCQN